MELISRKESRNESVQNAAKRKRLKYQDRFAFTNRGWVITQAQLLKEGGTKRHYTWTGFLDMIDHGHPVVRPKAFYVYI